MTDYWRPHRARMLHLIIRLELWRRLAGLHVRGVMRCDGHAVNVIIANHTGRYDGFAIWREWFSHERAGRLFTLMLQSQIDKNRVFKGAGAVGFDPDRPQSLRAVYRFMERDVQPGDAVVMFPQGRILPGDAMPLGFRQLPRLVMRCPHPLKLTAVGLATEMLHLRRPSVFMDIDEPVDVAPSDDTVLLSEELVTKRVAHIRSHLHRWGEQAVTQFSRI